MSWKAFANTLTSTIEAEGYKRIPENKTCETAATSHDHKSFELKFRGMGDLVQRANNNMSYENKVLLRVRYMNMDSGTMDDNGDLIINLITAIKNDTNFVSFLSEPTVTDLDNKHIIMEVNFLYGVAGC